MARVTTGFSDKYEIKSYDASKRAMVVVVDMVNGFVKQGALHDIAIMDITPNIISLLDKYQAAQRVFFRDCHKKDSVEFKSFPEHCLDGDIESEIIDELQDYSKKSTVIKKNSTNGFATREFMDILDKEINNIDEFIVVGCCTDICVLQFCLGLNSYLNERDIAGKSIIVPIDCNETYHIDGIHDAVACNEYSFMNLAGNGVKIVSTIK